tara:strand:+ start:1820 stop:2053 length:234 start_codon:yes stop_codon:yes gene_type:complete
MNKQNTKLENYLELKQKHDRMQNLVDAWAFDYSIEKLKPLLDDGFEGNDLIEYFTIRLIDYIENKYESTKQIEDGGK